MVITGGLAPENNANGYINEITFLKDMYADGAEGYFDALGDHPYSYPALPDTYEPWSGWSQMDTTPTSLESVMAANGDSGKPIWITEVGAPSGGPDSVGTGGSGQELTQAIDGAKQSPWVGAVYLYTYEDSGGDASNRQGLVRPPQHGGSRSLRRRRSPGRSAAERRLGGQPDFVAFPICVALPLEGNRSPSFAFAAANIIVSVIRGLCPPPWLGRLHHGAGAPNSPNNTPLADLLVALDPPECPWRGAPLPANRGRCSEPRMIPIERKAAQAQSSVWASWILPSRRRR